MGRRKVALITGIAGQDGGYLVAFLLSKGYIVHGLVRWDSYPDPLDGRTRMAALGLLDGQVTFHHGDVTDAHNVSAIIKQVQPDEIYHLAAMSHVGVSFETPAAVVDINVKGSLAIFEAVRLLDMGDRVRIYQASSSEMFGSSAGPQNEDTPMHPCSPYGAAKLAAYWLARTYRDSYGMFISNGILFNHESPQRGEDFVTRKITKAAAEIEAGADYILYLGNLDSARDWGHARDYVRGMWMMLQHAVADDFVLATGQTRTVRAFVTRAYASVGIALIWRGEGLSEIGCDARSGKIMVAVDPQFFRPKDVNYLLGDPAKARDVLSWRPEIDFDALVTEMVNADRALLESTAVDYNQGVLWRTQTV